MKIKKDAQGRVTDVLPAGAKAEKDVKSEAPIYIEIDRQTESRVLEQLKSNIEHALGDVKRAVEDWPLMMKKMKKFWLKSTP